MLRSLIFYWRRNLAVAAGAAVATAVLAGALLVGGSVEESLRRLTLDRLGEIDLALVGDTFFRTELARELETELGDGFHAAPAILLSGSAAHASSGARSARVNVLGVAEAFDAFFPSSPPLAPHLERRPGQLFPPVAINAALARELGASEGDAILLSFERSSEIPRETLLGDDDPEDVLETVRLTLTAILPDRTAAGREDDGGAEPGRFTLRPEDTVPHNAFVALPRLGRALDRRGRANALLVAASGRGTAEHRTIEQALEETLTLGDLGLELTSEDGWVEVTSRRLVLRPAVVSAVQRWADDEGVAVQRVLAYLANEMTTGGQSLPYSTVAAVETPVPEDFGRLVLVNGEPAPRLEPDEILLNAWAAEDLGASVGDEIEMSYYAVGTADQLVAEERSFSVVGVVALEGLGADPSLTPEVPGVSDADDMSEWDPPFPVDLSKIRPADEEYWDRYRGAPKAFVDPQTGTELWTSRFGTWTALRVAVPGGQDPTGFRDVLARDLLAALPPAAFGLAFQPVKAQGLDAASGATDWSALFLGFSLFLIVAAALLVGLLFRLAVEQRGEELGLRLAVGFPVAKVRRQLLGEGLALAVVGVAAGLALGVAYASLLLEALGSWWKPLLGEGAPSFLTLHVSPERLVVGGLAALFVVVITIYLALRKLVRVPARALLAGATTTAGDELRSLRGPRRWAVGSLVLTVALGIAAAQGMGSEPALFFGLGAALLVLGLSLFGLWCRRPRGTLPIQGSALPAMAAGNAARNPGRSLLALGLVAAACFVLVAVTANRRDPRQAVLDESSGTGGFELIAETRVPLRHDLNTPEGRAELGISEETSHLLESATVYPLRLLPGEDASCLNLYRPQQPRVLGVPDKLVERDGFTFHGTLEETDDPWSLLHLELPPETDPDAGETVPVVPALGDESSVRWILQMVLGDDLVMVDDRGERVRLRIAGLVARSIFQSELLISEEAFLRHFPDHGGRRVFLIESRQETTDDLARALESDLGDWGLDAISAPEKLASFQAVENLYLTTFQALGGLGLLLGTLGLGVILVRNVLERRGELATLRAFGFRRRTLSILVLAENGVLLLAGVAVGSGAGFLAVLPHLLGQSADVPWGSLGGLLALVVLVGLAACLVAVAGVLRVELLPVLKSEG